MYEKIKERYLKYYITDAQLARYVSLGVITEEQASEIKLSRNMENSTGGGHCKLTLILRPGMEVLIR